MRNEENKSNSDKVFICYARTDKDFVLGLAKKLKDSGVSIWLDQWDIPSGADWDRAIDQAIHDCSQFLILLSPISVSSEEVRGELSAALRKKKMIIPVLYQQCEIPRRLLLLQYTDFTHKGPGEEAALQDLCRILGSQSSKHHLKERRTEDEEFEDSINVVDSKSLEILQVNENLSDGEFAHSNHLQAHPLMETRSGDQPVSLSDDEAILSQTVRINSSVPVTTEELKPTQKKSEVRSERPEAVEVFVSEKPIDELQYSQKDPKRVSLFLFKDRLIQTIRGKPSFAIISVCLTFVVIISLIVLTSNRSKPNPEQGPATSLSEKTVEDPEVYKRLGDTLSEKGEYVEAEAKYRKAVELNPNHAMYYYKLGLALAEQKKYKEAEEPIRKAIELNRNEASYLYELGLVLHGQEKYDQAESAFRKAIDLNSNEASYHHRMARAQYALKKFDEALVAYERAVEINPNDVSYHRSFAIALIHIKGVGELEKKYRKARGLKPDNAMYSAVIGLALNYRKRFQEAEIEYRRALDIDPAVRTLRPNPAVAFYLGGLGISLLSQKKYDEAERTLLSATKHDPKDHLNWINLGIVQIHLKKFDDAVWTLIKALELDPKSAEGYTSLGVAYQSQGKYQQAEEAYDQALSINPNYALARVNFTNLKALQRKNNKR
jgi:tetratricopeptide (TPR) repeat protein